MLASISDKKETLFLFPIQYKQKIEKQYHRASIPNKKLHLSSLAAELKKFILPYKISEIDCQHN